MKKIIASLVAIAMVVGVVGTSAYALFSDTVTVSGITISAGNADLLVGPSPEVLYNTEQGWNTGLNLSGMYPGYGYPNTQYTNIYLRNASTSPISLNVAARLTTLPGEWGNYLTYAVQVYVEDMTTNAGTGWKSLPQWQAGQVSLPGSPLAQNETRQYRVYVRIPYQYGTEDAGYSGVLGAGADVGNEIAGQALTGMAFTFTGTQVQP